MTSLKELLRRLMGRQSPGSPEVRASDLSYRVHWMNVTRVWPPDQRQRAVHALQTIISQPDFIPNEFERIYQVPEVDDHAHAGASLRALLDVLQSFEPRNNAEA